METFRDWVGPVCGVIGAALGIWNFWRAQWGSVPRYGVLVTHVAANRFVMRNTGRRDFIATHPLTDTTALTTLPKMFEVAKKRPTHFELTYLSRGEPYPAHLKLRVETRSRFFMDPTVIADLPYSEEVELELGRRAQSDSTKRP